MGACGPPGASRCSARASLRTPSRPPPPHDGASPAPYIPGSEAIGLKGVPTADSTSRGVAAGRSAERGTSAAATGGGGRSAPDPDQVQPEKRLLCLVVQRFALRLLATAAAVLLASALFPNLIVVESPLRAVVFALVLGILNAFLRPILLLLTLPLNLLTLGLFTLVVNAIVFWIASGFDLGVSVHDFGAAFLGALVVSAVSFVASRMLT